MLRSGAGISTVPVATYTVIPGCRRIPDSCCPARLLRAATIADLACRCMPCLSPLVPQAYPQLVARAFQDWLSLQPANSAGDDNASNHDAQPGN